MTTTPAVFVDTSTWYSAASTGDRHNERAKALLRDHPRRLITDHIVIETWRLLAHRLGWATAERWFGGVRSGIAVIEQVTDVDLERAWAIGEAFTDQHFSLVDRTSFAVMERLHRHHVLTLDDDFAVYRFGPSRRQAFVVIR